MLIAHCQHPRGRGALLYSDPATWVRGVGAALKRETKHPTASLRIADGDYERSKHKLRPGDTCAPASPSLE